MSMWAVSAKIPRNVRLTRVASFCFATFVIVDNCKLAIDVNAIKTHTYNPTPYPPPPTIVYLLFFWELSAQFIIITLIVYKHYSFLWK